MQRYTLPDGWETFDDNVLEARLTEIATYTARLDIDAAADEETGTPSGLEVAESLADAKEAIQAHLAAKADAAAELASRREAALARLTDPEPEVVDPDPEPEVETVELAADDTDPEPEEEESDPEPEPAPAAAELAADPEPAAEVEPTTEPAPAPAAKPASQVLAGMRARQTPAEAPHTTSDNRRGVLTTVGEATLTGWKSGDSLADNNRLINYMTDKLNRRDRGGWNGPQSKVTLASADWGFTVDETLSASDVSHNAALFTSVADEWKAEQDTLVAAGAPCAPISPTYDFNHCWEIQRPVESGIPMVGAPRGGIRFRDQIAVNAMDAAVTTKTAAEKALLPGDVGFVTNNCERVTCPGETEVLVGEHTWCVTFDNLQSRVDPELTREILQVTALAFARSKDIFYLDELIGLAAGVIAIQTDATNAQPATYGASRSIIRDLATAAHNYRKRNNMSRDAIVDVWLPDVVEELLLVDTANDYNNGGISALEGPGMLTAFIAQRLKLNVMFTYYDSTTVGYPSAEHAGTTAQWNPLPNSFRSIMHAPGAVVRPNAGVLDLGVVRDSTLNSQSELQMFATEWIAVARPGCEVVQFDHTACYSGTGPLGVAAESCPTPA